MGDPASIISLSLGCLQGCVKGLIILGKARHYNRDVTDVRLQTDILLHSLTSWAQEAGLLRDPPTLLVSVHDAPLVPEILTQLEVLLSDMEELRCRYGVHLQPMDDEVESVNDNPSILLKTEAQRGQWSLKFGALSSFKKSEPWKKLRWVTLDDKKFARLLDKARSYTTELIKLLEQAKQKRMAQELEICLRTAILHSDRVHELDVISRDDHLANSKIAISAAARLKQSRLRLGIQDISPSPSIAAEAIAVSKSSSNLQHIRIRNDSKIDIPLDMRLPLRLLTLDRVARAQKVRAIASYHGVNVLLEWKYVTEMNNSVILKRINQTAALLQETGASLHSLSCRGFVEDRVGKRYGYVFDLPSELNPAVPRLSPAITNSSRSWSTTPDLHSLRELFDVTPSPSLNNRLSLAVRFIETLLNLHTSGWLHKDLRSDNVIVLSQSGPATAGISTIKEELPQNLYYVAGYVRSRMDSPGEWTEPLQSERDVNLYHHPLLLGDVRPLFRKIFDVFSAGCTLLEIGMWSDMKRILERQSSIGQPISSRSRLNLPVVIERSFSDPTYTQPAAASRQTRAGSITDSHNASSDSHPDLMQLRFELLLSQVGPVTAQSAKQLHCSPVLTALEAAMGEKYTSIVAKFLAAAEMLQASEADEHEFILALELEARNALMAITEVL